MTAVSRTTLKTYFTTGAMPTQAQFFDFIDSCPNILDDKIPLIQIAEFTSNFSDFQPNSGPTGSFVIGSLPAGATPLYAFITNNVAFGGGSVTRVDMALQTSPSFVMLGGTQVSIAPSTQIGAISETFASASTDQVTITVSASNRDVQADITAYAIFPNPGVIDDLTAGAMTVWVIYVPANPVQ